MAWNRFLGPCFSASAPIEPPELVKERIGLLAAEDRRGELEVLLFELRIGERRVRIADARGLQMLLAPAARLDRDARGALPRKCGIDFRIDPHRGFFH